LIRADDVRHILSPSLYIGTVTHPDLSAYRGMLSWLWIYDYIWYKEIA